MNPARVADRGARTARSLSSAASASARPLRVKLRRPKPRIMRIRPTLRAKPKAVPFERALLPRVAERLLRFCSVLSAMGSCQRCCAQTRRIYPPTRAPRCAQRGTVAGLVPIVELQSAVRAASAALPEVGAVARALDAVPAQEVAFKRTFDEFSEGVSYKQVWRDQNAFLVYDTGGFDGVGRPSIENDTPSAERQRQQYGLRNEAWLAIADVRPSSTFCARATLPPTSTAKCARRCAARTLPSIPTLDSCPSRSSPTRGRRRAGRRSSGDRSYILSVLCTSRLHLRRCARGTPRPALSCAPSASRACRRGAATPQARAAPSPPTPRARRRRRP